VRYTAKTGDARVIARSALQVKSFAPTLLSPGPRPIQPASSLLPTARAAHTYVHQQKLLLLYPSPLLLTMHRLEQGGAVGVVAVGGDGTLHQVVQGFFQNGVNMFPSAFLGFIPCGTGCDFRRGLGWSMDLEESAKRLLDPKVRKQRPALVPQETCPDGGKV